MGCSVDQALLEAVTEALVSGAEERQNKVVLTWKYGGLSASIAGAPRMRHLKCWQWRFWSSVDAAAAFISAVHVQFMCIEC
jgi:hypothetical protein